MGGMGLPEAVTGWEAWNAVRSTCIGAYSLSRRSYRHAAPRRCCWNERLFVDVFRGGTCGDVVRR